MSSFQGSSGRWFIFREVLILEFFEIKKERTMKQIFTHRTAALVIFLALILVACGTAAPTGEQPAATQAPPQPTQTAVIVVETVVEKVLETVVVTVIPTQVPTEVPSVTPLPPTPTAVPPTQAVAEATQPPAPTVAAAAISGGGPIPVDNAFGGGWFVELTRSQNDFALRCQPSKEITFSVKPSDPNITQVDFYYRIQDRATGAVFDWQNAGRMISGANGSFSIVLSGEDVNANFRKPNAWFDYQFIGSSQSGVVGRSEKIEQQVTYTFDCP
jgi:hypothetical protein